MKKLWNDEPAKGVRRVSVEDTRGGRAVVVVADEPERVAEVTGRSVRSAERVLLVLSVEGESEPLAAALYDALQRARIREKTVVCVRSEQAEPRLVALLALEREAGPGSLCQTLDRASFACFASLDEEARADAVASFVPEIDQTVTRWSARFLAGKWAQAVLTRSLTRMQYVQTLYNMHQYVRFTTRLLGRAVAISDDLVLRNHFLDHLGGEVNHELIIERDLRHLGADVAWLLGHRVPNASTWAFMAAEQSMVSFERDPVLFMACPLAAEGITARLDDAFLAALRASIASWGVEEPERATLFFASHVHTDGGDDGHWQKTLRVLGRSLQSDIAQQAFLSVLRLAMNAIEDSFNSNCLELAWSEGAAPHRASTST